MSNPKMIFVNLPVSDLDRSVAFYEAVGGTKEPKFSNDAAAMIRFSEVIHVMLLTHDFYKGFTRKPIADGSTSEALICLSADSPEAVDSMVGKAEAAGGKPDIGPKQEMGGFMYGRSFEDPDGHHWEVMWMDPGFAEKGAHPVDKAAAA